MMFVILTVLVSILTQLVTKRNLAPECARERVHRLANRLRPTA